MAVAPRTRSQRRRRIVGALTWLLAIALAAGWFFYLRPASMGGPAGYVIVSGESMEPMMHTGDLAVVHRRGSYKVGDVVAYRIPKQDVGGGMLVIHRITGGDAESGFVLQGDNRETQDMWRPRAADVVGSLQWHVPHVGTVLFLLRTPLVIGGVAGFLGFWLILNSGEGRRREDEATADVDEPVVEEVAPAPVVIPVAPRRRSLLTPANLAAVGVVVLSAASAKRALSRLHG